MSMPIENAVIAERSILCTISSLPIILSGLGVGILYYAAPLSTPKILNAIKAGLVAAFFLEVVKSVILIYIQFFPLYELIYGTTSMILLFMLWVYLSWMIILFGGCYCFVIERHNKQHNNQNNQKIHTTGEQNV